MFKRLMQLFNLSPEEAEQIDAMEAASRSKVMLRKVNRELSSAEQQIAKAEKRLWDAQLECQQRYRDYLYERKQRPTTRKAAGALQYAAKLRLAAGRWELAERMCAKGRERLVVARAAKREAKARQTKASTLFRQAKRALNPEKKETLS